MFNVYIIKISLTCSLRWAVLQNVSWYPCIVRCCPHLIDEEIDSFLGNESLCDERYAGKFWSAGKYYRHGYFFWIDTRRAPLFCSLRSMVGTVPGVLFLVTCCCVLGAVCRVLGAIGLIVVVTSGAVPTLWVGASPSEVLGLSTLWGGLLVEVANLLSAVAIAFRSFLFDFLPKLCTASVSSLCTSTACCFGVKVGNKQCCRKRSNEPETQYALVSGT